MNDQQPQANNRASHDDDIVNSPDNNPSLKEDIKADHFVDAYIKHGMNGKRAYKSLSPQVTDETAMTQASRLLRKDKVQKALKDRIPNEQKLSKIITSALEAETPKGMDWKTKHRYLETALKLKGYLQNEQQQTTNIALVIRK